MDTIDLSKPMNAAEIRQRSQEVCDTFRENGLMAVVPARAPIATYVFSMGLDASSEVYRFWVGHANVDVVDITQEPKRQAIVRVAEKKHTIEVPTEVRCLKGDVGKLKAQDYTRSHFPTGTKISWAKSFTWEEDNNEYNRRSNVSNRLGTLQRNIYVTVPTFDNTFLMGYDEVKCFISQLPQHVTTVAQAHKVLRPPNLLKTSVRQGEWFFTPCSRAEIATIEQEIEEIGDHRFYEQRVRRNSARNTSNRSLTPLVAGSSHRALRLLWIGSTIYVDGYVVDSRQGRHAKLELDRWHRVTRNQEVADTATSNGTKVEPVRYRQNWD